MRVCNELTFAPFSRPLTSQTTKRCSPEMRSLCYVRQMLSPLSLVSRRPLQCCSTAGRYQQVSHLRTKAKLQRSSRALKFTATEHRSWMLRLAHENSYLSWSRNAAICAGVGATIVIVEMQYSIPMADYYAVGFTDLGLAFLTFGSIQHLYSSYRLRKLLQLSMAGYIWILSYTSFFALIYYALVQSKFKILPIAAFEEENT